MLLQLQCCPPSYYRDPKLIKETLKGCLTLIFLIILVIYGKTGLVVRV